MTWFDWVRYAMALMLVAMVPPAFLYWFVIHPFVAFWRRVGYGWGMVAGLGQYVVVMMVLVLLRQPLLATDFGTSGLTIAIGVPFIVTGAAVRRRWRKQLRMRTLYGLPELAPERQENKLLCEGIYARVRHPRYLEMVLGITGWALLSNYLASYLVIVYACVALALLIPLEERELVARFGRAYEDYRRRVPALLPRWRRGS
jgi:protein-S-isoprenylcysteine O-methyltransferase Ste14